MENAASNMAIYIFFIIFLMCNVQGN